MKINVDEKNLSIAGRDQKWKMKNLKMVIDNAT